MTHQIEPNRIEREKKNILYKNNAKKIFHRFSIFVLISEEKTKTLCVSSHPATSIDEKKANRNETFDDDGRIVTTSCTFEQFVEQIFRCHSNDKSTLN